MTSTPSPFEGHNYLGAQIETVSPANGSISLRIGVPLPPSKGVNIPFTFAYDSNGVFFPASVYGGVGWADSVSNLSQGGWSYSVPQLSVQYSPYTFVFDPTGQNPAAYTCDGYANYVYQDASGNRHNLGINPGTASSGCQPELPYGAGTFGPSGNMTYTQEGLYSVTTPPVGDGTAPPVDVYDPDGNHFAFPSISESPNSNTLCTSTTNTVTPLGCAGTQLFSSVTDRYGNSVSAYASGGNLFGYRDSSGRTALSISSFAGATWANRSPITGTDQITASGLSQPFTVNWQALSSSLTLTQVADNNHGYAHCQSSGNFSLGSHPSTGAISTITLPNGQQYTFYYDPVYGLIDRIVYPNGGYVRYVWGLNRYSQVGDYPTLVQVPITDGEGIPTGQSYTEPGPACIYYYDSPVVMQRFVSYSGCTGGNASSPCSGTEQEEQDFTYCTVWNQVDSLAPQVPGCDAPITNPAIYTASWNHKTTTVITHDNVRGSAQRTVYTYTPNGWSLIPVESKIQYYDTDGTLMQTVNKQFNSDLVMTQQVVKWPDANNSTMESDWTYSTDGNDLLQAKMDYDYGSSAPGPMLRETIMPSYQSFPNVTHLVNKPNCVIVLGGSSPSSAACSSPNNSNIVAGVSYIYDGGSNTVGNLTNRRDWLSPNGSAYVETKHTYYPDGHMQSTTDPNGTSTTTYTYGDSSGSLCGSAGTYLTGIIAPQLNGVPHSQRFAYDCPTGRLTASTDENSNTTNYTYSDPFNRLTDVQGPASVQNGGNRPLTHTAYIDGPSPSEISTNPVGVQSATFYDGMGHTLGTKLITDPVSPIYNWTQYDGEGRPYQQWNPTRCAPPLGTSCSGETSFGITTTTYDGLGRVKVVAKPDGSTTNTYMGNSTAFTDEAGNTWLHTSDGLGRLTNVIEPGSLNTAYTYDTLGNLKTVAQTGTGGETPRLRSFTYDQLSRLVTSTNPETGTICYGITSSAPPYPTPTATNCTPGYDPDGNLQHKTDARSIQTTYTYDILNRLTWKTYSDGTPSASFYYDATLDWGLGACGTGYFVQCNTIGRLSSAYTADGVTTGQIFGYDAMGRLDFKASCTDARECGHDQNSQLFWYDLAGNQTIYEDGDDWDAGVYYGGHGLTYDSAGRLQSVFSFMGPAPGTTNFTANSYGPAGLTQSTLGNGLNETRSYDSRMRVTSYSLTNPASSQVYAWNAGFAPTGNLSSSADTVNGTYGYFYDPLNRLTAAGSAGVSLQWTYDSFGNRTSQQLTGGTGTSRYDGYSLSATNRPDGLLSSFDQGGNLLTTGLVPLTYDAENRLIAAGSETYLYNAMGDRVAKYNSGTLTSVYLYDTGGHAVTELDGSYNVRRREVHAGNLHLGTYDQNGNFTYTSSDWLGTERARTDSNGNLCQTTTSQPFGDNDQTTGSCSPSTTFFTGKERDAESGLDYFGARYYASSMGRWMSPDTTTNLTPANPQGWNKYAYTFNNPITMTDPTGNWPTYVHNRIIDYVFGYLLTDSQRAILKRSSLDVDGLLNGNQNPGNAFKHSQLAANLRPTEGGGVIPDIQDESVAVGLADNFVETNLGKAVDAQLAFEASPQFADSKNKTSDDALWYFGQALHTRTDASSPWHDNFKTSWGPGNPLGSAIHVIGEYTLGGLQFGSQYEAEYAAQTLWSQYQDRLMAARVRKSRKQPANKK